MSNLDLSFLPGQLEVLRDNHRFKILICGRRWGKSVLASRIVIISALKKENGTYFLVSPSYSQTSIIWRMIKRSLPREYIRRVMEGEKYIELKNGSLIFAKSGDSPDCYDEQTEVLTDEGWKFFKKLNKSEKVLTLNQENYTLEWKLPRRYIKEYYSGEMYSINSRKLDLLVTPNHKFFIESEDGIKKFKTLDKITHHDKIPMRPLGFNIENNESISELDCAIMGFYLSEGTAYGNNGGDITKRKGNYSIIFCQTEGVKGGDKGDVRSKFKEILFRGGYNAHENKIGLYILNKELWSKLVVLGNAYTKHIPKEYKNLPQNKLNVLLHWLIMGDGTTRRNGERNFYTVSKQLADDVQEIAIKCGFAANIKIKINKAPPFIKGKRVNSLGFVYEVSILRRKYSYFSKTGSSYISKTNYSGNVYCIEVDNHVILVRRNGKMCFSGNSLRGEGLDGVVLDEAAMLKPEVWNEAIRPALSDKGGWALLISTPKGKTWLYDLFLRGMDDTQAEFKSFSFPSFANPLLDPSEIEEMRRNLPELSFRQEVLAEFIEGGGVVFRNVSNCMISQREEPISGEYYVVGVDLGRHEDFTVISVGKIRECRQVYMERFNQTDWDYIKDRIRSVHYKYNKGAIIIDSTGYGDPIYEDLGKEGLNITGYHINAASKPKLIENLQIMLENSVIQLLKDKQLELEMNAYSYTLLPSGNVRFEAPKGFHDDCVIGVALMAQGFIGQGGGIIGEIQEDDKEQPTDYADMENATEDEWDELRLNDED